MFFSLLGWLVVAVCVFWGKEGGMWRRRRLLSVEKKHPNRTRARARALFALWAVVVLAPEFKSCVPRYRPAAEERVCALRVMCEQEGSLP